MLHANHKERRMPPSPKRPNEPIAPTTIPGEPLDRGDLRRVRGVSVKGYSRLEAWAARRPLI